MKRVALVVFCTAIAWSVVMGVAALAQGLAVPPNTTPPPDLLPPSHACYPTGVLPSAIVASDINSDGWIDLGVSCSNSGTVWRYLNAGLILPGPGVFPIRGPVQPDGTFPQARGLVAGPAAGNYSLICDVWVPPATEQHVFTGAFLGPGFVRSSPATAAAVLVTADFNHVPGLELLVLQAPPGIVLGGTLLGGAFGPLPAPPVDAVAADFNQDGWTDLAVLCNNNVYVYHAVQYAAVDFNPSIPPLAVPFAATAIDAGDFDADGLTDLVVVGSITDATGSNPGFALVYLNAPAAPGTGLAPYVPMATWGFSPSDVVVADFDANGRDDFAVTNQGSHTVTMFLADGEELIADERRTTGRCLSEEMLDPDDRLKITFGVYKLKLQCGFYPVSIAAADFDWNGKVDLAVALKSAELEICPQNASCIEILFDPSCGLHPGDTNVPPQTPHEDIPNVDRSAEPQECDPCKEEGGGSGN